MHRLNMVAVLALALAACAPQTIIANKQQAVVEASSHTDAVQIAVKECGKFDRWPLLQRHGGSEYWFSCNESDEAIAQRQMTLQESARKQNEANRRTQAPPPAPQPVAATAAPADLTATAQAEDQAKEQAKAKKPSGKGSWIQLGAFRDKAVARNYVSEIRKAHAGVVKGHDIVLNEKTVGERGTFLFARLGPYARSADARKACGTLKARGTSCYVVAGG